MRQYDMRQQRGNRFGHGRARGYGGQEQPAHRAPLPDLRTSPGGLHQHSQEYIEAMGLAQSSLDRVIADS